MDMKKWKKPIMSVIAFILVAFGIINVPEGTDLFGSETPNNELNTPVEVNHIVEGESYDTPKEVAEYHVLYGELPDNYLTKKEAAELGWVAQEGNLWEVAPGASIGGDYFGNFEELLPEKSGRDYYEADIEYEGGRRNAKRLVYSNDGLYFYTDDHYESFEEIKVGDTK